MEHPDFGTICECECHRDGNNTMHFMECCIFCGCTYISEDGVVDLVRYGALLIPSMMHGMRGAGEQ